MKMISVNLIPKVRRDAQRCRDRARRWTLGCTAYVLLMGLGYAICLAGFDSGSDHASADLAKSSRQVDDLARALDQLRPKLTEAQAKLGVARTVGGQPD